MFESSQNEFSSLASIISKADICPLKWDSRSQTFQHLYLSKSDNSKASSKIKYAIKLALHRIFLLLMICQVAESTWKSSFSRNIPNWLCIGLLMAYNVALSTCNTRHYTILNYITQIFRFFEIHKAFAHHGKATRRDILTKWYAMFSILGSFIVPAGFVFGFHCMSPQESVTLVGYWILRCLKDLPGTFLTIFVFVVNFWSWQIATFAALFCYCGIQMVCTCLLIKCIRTFWRIEKAGDAAKSSLERAITYRSLQLIGILQSEVETGWLSTAVILTATSATSLGIAIVVRLKWIEGNQVIILIAAYLVFACVISLLAILGGQAEVWEESKDMLLNLARLATKLRGTPAERKWQRRFWLSCGNLIKIKFGMHNFVENETPLNCLNWAIAMAVQFILVGR